MPHLNTIPAQAFNFGEGKGSDLSRRLDNASQNVFVDMGLPTKKLTIEKLVELMGDVAPATAAYNQLGKYPRKLFSSSQGADAGQYNAEQVKTLLSLMHYLQPEEVALKAHGVNEGMSKLIVDAAKDGRAAVEEGMTKLGLGAPLSEQALRERLPALLQEGIEQGKVPSRGRS